MAIKPSTLKITPVNGTEFVLGEPVQFTFTHDPNAVRNNGQHYVGHSFCVVEGEYFYADNWDDDGFQYAFPVSLAKYNTKGTTVTVKISTSTMYDYPGGFEEYEFIGDYDFEQEFTIPESLAPTISLTTGDNTDNRQIYGAYISGKSEPFMTPSIKTYYGAEITNCTLKILNHSHVSSGFWLDRTGSIDTNYTYTGEYAFGGNNGVIYSYCTSVNFEIQITDSRGFTATLVHEEPSYQYANPVISSLTVKRCDSSGVLTSSGAYLRVDFNVEVSALGNNNSAVYTLQYKKTSDSSYTEISMTEFDGTYSLSGYKVFPALQTASYDVQMTAEDAYSVTTRHSVGLSIRKLWSALKSGLGFAFGKIAERANTLDMGFAIYMNTNKLHGLATPTDDDEAANKGYIDTAIKDLPTKEFVNEKTAGMATESYVATQRNEIETAFNAKIEELKDLIEELEESIDSSGGSGGGSSDLPPEEETP